MKKIYNKPALSLNRLHGKDVLATSDVIYGENELPLVPFPQD